MYSPSHPSAIQLPLSSTMGVIATLVVAAAALTTILAAIPTVISGGYCGLTLTGATNTSTPALATLRPPAGPGVRCGVGVRWRGLETRFEFRS